MTPLPPLPEPAETHSYDFLGKPLEYTAEDMRAYALAAVAINIKNDPA